MDVTCSCRNRHDCHFRYQIFRRSCFVFTLRPLLCSLVMAAARESFYPRHQWSRYTGQNRPVCSRFLFLLFWAVLNRSARQQAPEPERLPSFWRLDNVLFSYPPCLHLSYPFRNIQTNYLIHQQLGQVPNSLRFDFLSELHKTIFF